MKFGILYQMVLFWRGVVDKKYRIILEILHFLLDLQVFVAVIGISSFVLFEGVCFVLFCILRVEVLIEEV